MNAVQNSTDSGNLRTAFAPFLVPIFDDMTGDEINAIPEDDFADAIYAKLKDAPPLLTSEDMDEIEAMWERQRLNRRCALAMLTIPWAELNQKIADDREFAVAAAQLYDTVGDIGLYKGIHEFMDVVKARLMVALAGRGDMTEIIETANATE